MTPVELEITSAASSPEAGKAGAHERIRDTLMLEESVLVECIEEVISRMSATRGMELRGVLMSNQQARASVRRLTCDVGLLLSLAKTQEDESAFEDSFGLIAQIPFAEHQGLMGAYAKAMVRTDLDSMAEGDAYIYECMPADIVRQRLDQVLQFIDKNLQ